MVFDKTGTLTKGKPSVTDIVAVAGSRYGEDEILGLSAVAEKQSETSARLDNTQEAMEKFGDEKLPDPDSFESISGQGVRVSYGGGDTLLLGNSRLRESNGVGTDGGAQSTLDELRADGKMAMLLAVNNRIAGVIAVADIVKEPAQEAIEHSRR